MSDRKLFFAINYVTGELVTRDSRPLYAYQEDWEPFIVRDGVTVLAMPISQLIPATRMLYGARPLLEQVEPNGS